MPSIREINEVVSTQMEKLENNRYENLDGLLFHNCLDTDYLSYDVSIDGAPININCKKPKPINTII